MKKTKAILLGALIAIHAFLPVCAVAGLSAGYLFSMKSYAAVSVITAIMSVGVTAVLFIRKNCGLGKTGGVLAALVLPITVINAFLTALKADSDLVTVMMLLCAVCSAVVTIGFSKPTVLKIVTSALSGLSLFPLGFMALLVLFAGNFTAETVKSTLYSPDGRYRAEIVESDQGALGGNTVVRVQDMDELDLWFCRFYKDARRVYTGDMLENSDISWADENTLLVNDEEIDIG